MQYNAIFETNTPGTRVYPGRKTSRNSALKIINLNTPGTVGGPVKKAIELKILEKCMAPTKNMFFTIL